MKILDPGHDPILGRLHGFNRKHRLRTKHYAEIEDFPPDGSFDVLDPSRLGAVDFYTNEDQLFVVSEKLCTVLETLEPIVKHAVDAGGTTVYVIEPVSDDDVMYASDGFPPYSKSGYNILSATNIRPEGSTEALFTHLRNSGLLLISQRLCDATDAITWSLHEALESYEPYREHPYLIFDTGYADAAVETFHGKWSNLDEVPAHPLAEIARDEKLKDDPNDGWARRITGDDDEKLAVTRYSCGFVLPELHGKTDDDLSKSRRKKQWRETKKAKVADFKVPNVSGELREELEARGVELTYSRAVLRDTTLEEEKEFWVIYPPVVEWIDWQKSDVGFLWSSMVDGYHDLHPTEESYSATDPIVRIAGTTLVLIHESLADLFPDDVGFYLTPLHHRFVSRNLDDYLRV